MATAITGVSLPIRASIRASAADAGTAHAGEVRSPRRRIDPQSGRALEILGHAIEYLADEFVHEGGSLSACDPRVDAIQLLMALNRQIYFACPEAPTLGESLRAWFWGR